MPRSAERIARAKAISARYWGVDDPEANDFSECAKRLRALNLKKKERAELRDWLPTHASGVTGDRIVAIDEFLDRL